MNNLSSAQFGDGQPDRPEAEQPKFDQPSHPRPPLPYTTDTRTSAGYAAAWTKPGGMPLTSATFGTIFRPYGGSMGMDSQPQATE